jgi:uncharacterized glyoxalase superfamily protein PhnB
MTWGERIIAAHRAVTDAVSHAARVKSERYFVWQEDGSNDLAGDNGHGERAVTGTTDLYTKQELDPWADALGESFDAHGIAWALNSVQYEADTGFYHYEWVWEAL